MRTRIVRGAMAVAAALLIPACDYTFFFDGQSSPPPPGPGQGFPFTLQLPFDGDINVLTNPELSWNAADGAQGYRLQISTTPDFANVIWDESDLTITSVFLQPSLTYFTTFYWRIYALQAGGGMLLAGGSPFSFRTEGGGFLVPPSFSPVYPFSVTPPNPRIPTFVWQSTPGATSYTLQLSLDPTFASPLLDLPGLHINNLVCPLTLAPTTIYYWQVIAVGLSGSTTSSVAQFRTTP